MSYDFANLLFGGPCNRRCPFCIGQQLPPRVNQNNLNRWPLTNIDLFVAEVLRHNVQQIVFTGTTTDPQLYRHEQRLLGWLRERLPGRSYSLHSNGALALRKLDAFHAYDKACISFPSFHSEIYARMMGSPHVPDLAELLRVSRIPIKVSCLINEHNYPEHEEFIDQCQQIGLQRLVLRSLAGETRRWNLLPGRTPIGDYRGNPVYQLGNMEVTVWNFHQSESTSLNLFADGTLGASYLLTQTPELRAG